MVTPRIGLDIGNVIIGGDRKKIAAEDTSFITATDVEAIRNTPAVEGALEAVAAINDMFRGEVWLVSKCKENTQRKTRKWLKHHRFYELTGLHRSKLLFCYARSDKHVIAEGLSLTHFVDDNLGCIAPMQTVRHRLWFGPQDQDAPEGIIHTRTWSDVLEFLRSAPFHFSEHP